MLDIQFVRDNAELVAEKSKQKGIKVNVPELLKLDEQRRQMTTAIDELRAKRNAHAAELKRGRPTEAQIKAGRDIKDELTKLEDQQGKIEPKYQELLQAIPNTFPDDTPLGGEDANQPIKHWGEPSKTKTKDHLTWGEANDAIDFERGAKVAGNKFYYLKGGLVELELAVFQYALGLASKAGFTPMTVPHLVNSRVAAGTGFLPRGEERQIYKIEGEDLNLIATAEIPITGYHADEVLPKDQLPICYAGLSPAYRMEAGAYGKHSRGLFRVHQFNKLEMYVFCPAADSEQWHQKLLDFEEELCQALEIPYQVVRIAAGDLGAPAYKKFDIEYWSPADQQYHELMSCSNVTDYQARRLNIRTKDGQGKTEYVHTLNATAAAYSRIAIALIENHQTADGKVKIPQVLQAAMGGRTAL